MTIETLLLEKPSEHVLQVSLNRPDSANAINTAMMHDLYELWHELTLASDAIRCIIITGAGKHFCAGADYKQRQDLNADEWQQQHKLLEKAVSAMHDCPIPIIAAVNGAAIGGGFELCLHSDLALATRSAKFALPEVKLGIMPGMGASHLLPNMVGLRRAKQLMLTGESLTAKQALEWQLINQVTTAKELLPAAIELAQTIANHAPIAVQQAKKSINHGSSEPFHSAYALEIEAYNVTVQSQDRIEGFNALHDKRPANFKGQ